MIGLQIKVSFFYEKQVEATLTLKKFKSKIIQHLLLALMSIVIGMCVGKNWCRSILLLISRKPNFFKIQSRVPNRIEIIGNGTGNGIGFQYRFQLYRILNFVILEYRILPHIFKFGTIQSQFWYGTGTGSRFGTNCSSQYYDKPNQIVIEVRRETQYIHKNGKVYIKNLRY